METGKIKLRVLQGNMLLPLAMDTQWEETSSAYISPTAEDSEDEYVSAEEGDIGYYGPVTRSKARKS